MFEFEPKKVNSYSIKELLTFLCLKKATFGDFQKAGLWHDQQEELQKTVRKDEMTWMGACDTEANGSIQDAIDAFKNYLMEFGDTALHGYEAEMKIKELKKKIEKLYADLFAHMKEHQGQYKATDMQYLFRVKNPNQDMLEEDSPKGRFLKAGLTLNFEHLIDEGFVSANADLVFRNSILQDDFLLPQLKIEDLGDFPIDRDDIYFLGCPSSGKTCVLAGILNHLYNEGLVEYEAQFNEKGEDKCSEYFDKLIEGVSRYKAPQSTDKETVSFLKLNIGEKYDRKITAVELSGEAFLEMVESNKKGRDAWEALGASKCLANTNKKTIFFLLDYGTIIGQNDSISEVKQTLILNNALTVFCYDGIGKDRTQDCTMSKVKTVAVIVTKSDLMDKQEGRPLSQAERSDIAFKYLENRFKSFMNNLSNICRKYGINDYKGTRYKPFVMTFSLGQFYLGNSVVYDATDSKSLADFIQACTDVDYKGLLGFLRQGGQTRHK